MSENKCPLCGKDTVDDESFCRECQEMADSSLSEQLLAFDALEVDISSCDEEVAEEPEIIVDEETPLQTEAEVEDEISDVKAVPYSRRKARLTKNIIIYSLFFLFALAAVGGYFYWEKVKADDLEAAQWDKCIEENTPPVYSNYLRLYPSGKFQEQARQKILELREEETNKWKELRKTSDIGAYAAFLVDHPDSPHATTVKSVMDSLGWIKAQSENTAESYQVYISNAELGLYPGDYKALAQEKYEYLSQLKTLSGSDTKEIYKALEDFLAQLSFARYDKLQPMMSPTLDNFFGVKGQSRDVITKSIEADIKTRKIKSITYIIVDKQLNEVIQDSKGTYFFDVHLSRAITYKDKKKKREQVLLPVKVEMDKDKLIRFIDDVSKK